MKSKKYYILRNNTPETLQAFMIELDSDQRNKMKVYPYHGYLLIEKMEVPDGEGGTKEIYSKLVTISRGETLYPIVGNKVVFDYTGFSSPMVHINKEIYTWKEYSKMKMEVISKTMKKGLKPEWEQKV